MNKMHNDFINIIINLFEKIYRGKLDNGLNKESIEDKNEDEEFLYLNKLYLSLIDIKENSFDKRLNAIKSIDDIIKNNKENKNMKEKILEILKKHNIIKEIFGPNYHCEIIKNSKEVIKFLLSENQLTQEDIKLIWNCTNIGDSEAKETILNLLHELGDHLKNDYSIMLLKYIKETSYNNEISNEELELVYNLTMNMIDNLDINKNDNINNQTDESNKFGDSNKIIEVKLISFDKKIDCQIKCYTSDIFAKIEEELYNIYPEYRKTNNDFATNGNIVNRFQTLSENNIKNGQIIELIKSK